MEEREVSREKAEEYIKEVGIDRYFETSAKTGMNITEIFSIAARELYLSSKEDMERQAKAGVSLGTKEPKKKKGGCCWINKSY